MSDALLRLYHRLPSGTRSVAASLRGLYLRAWRYGPETDRLVAEALDRERWPPERWMAYQQERLAFVLHRAATQVPYYCQLWSARRRQGDRTSWHYVENWPVLTKETLRRNPLAFLADDCHPRRMFHEHTSGTTGTPLDLWWGRETVRAWYALFEARIRRWNDVSRYDRWAILGGQLVTPINQRRPPFWVWNAALNQLYLSSYHLTSEWMPYYLDTLRRCRIRYLWGYTSSLYALAQEVLRRERRELEVAVVLTNAEPLLDYQREVIGEAFQCPVRETYGMAEIVAAASECRHGNLHLWPEVGLVEVLDRDEPVSPGTAGDLVCTGLLNDDMPLIRYCVGDRGGMPSSGTACGCGRTLPVIASVEGRVDDTLYTSDGRRVGRLDPIFKARLPVREAQIIQEALDRIRIRYAPAPDFTPHAAQSMIARLQSRMGPVQVVLEEVPQIPREANGKFRAVICKLSAEDRQRVLTR